MIWFLVVIVIICYLKFVLHLKIDWKSFFRRGFKKLSDLFGIVLFVGKQRKGKNLFRCKLYRGFKN